MGDQQQILYRSFEPQDLNLTDDGRTLECQVVPYGQVAEIWNGTEDRFLECFDRGAFQRACKAPNRVLLSINHPGSDVVGFGREMEERDEGLFGRFRLMQSRAEYAREMISEGFSALSVGFVPLLRGTLPMKGVKHRVAVHLDHVAAVLSGTEAYPGAQVLAMRQQGGLMEGRDNLAEWSDIPATPELDSFSEQLEAQRAEVQARLARVQAVLAR
jgi:HK97 family phage prohead protease